MTRPKHSRWRQALVGSSALFLSGLVLSGLAGCRDFPYPMAVKVGHNPVSYTTQPNPPPRTGTAMPSTIVVPPQPTPIPARPPAPAVPLIPAPLAGAAHPPTVPAAPLPLAPLPLPSGAKGAPTTETETETPPLLPPDPPRPLSVPVYTAPIYRPGG